MLILSAVDGTRVLEVQLEGVVELNPLQCRELISALVATKLGSNIVLRIGTADWVRMDSSPGEYRRMELPEDLSARRYINQGIENA